MIRPSRRFLLAGAACAIFCVTCATRTASAQNSTAKPDNSAQNANQSQTAQDQSNNRADVQTTASIRKALMSDKGLSVDAQNIKIVTRDGKVTLMGPVKSDDEKQKIETDAATVVSRDNLVDQLTVKQ